MASRARSPGRLAAPAAGGRLPGLGLVTHRRHFNAASQRSHTGEPPTRHIFSSRRAAVRAHSIEEWGPPPSPTAFSRPQRRRAARPDWWGSRTSPSSTQRAQQSANESPPPAPKPEQTPGGAPRMAKAHARRPPAAVEPLPPFEPWMSVRRRLWRGQWRCEICARKWWAGERVGRRKRADSRQREMRTTRVTSTPRVT